MSGPKRRFRPPGQELEYRVSRELDALNVPHEHFGEGTREDSVDKIDFRLFRGLPGARPVEFQLTLLTGARKKLRTFVMTALIQEDRNPRVYLEVEASKALWYEVRDGRTLIARMVAKAMREILNVWNFTRSGLEDLLAVRLKIGRHRRYLNLEALSIAYTVGTNWLRDVQRWVERKREQAQQQRRAQERRLLRQQRQEALQRISAFRARDEYWRRFFEPLTSLRSMLERGTVPRCQPARVPVRVFVPRRCP